VPFDVRIDPEHKRVIATGRGSMAPEDFFEYQRSVWSSGELSGYDEVVDMTAVTAVGEPSPDAIRDLSALAASMDPGAASGKLAVVAPADLVFGLARMYQTFRSLNPQSTKQVSVFRTMAEALAWLGS